MTNELATPRELNKGEYNEESWCANCEYKIYRVNPERWPSADESSWFAAVLDGHGECGNAGCPPYTQMHSSRRHLPIDPLAKLVRENDHL